MAEQQKGKKAATPKTPRQQEIERLVAKGRDKRTEGEAARLDQLRQEEKRDRFCRLAPKRIQRCLDALDTLVACSATVSYEYTEAEAAELIAVISSKVDKVTAAFSDRKEDDTPFRFGRS